MLEDKKNKKEKEIKTFSDLETIDFSYTYDDYYYVSEDFYDSILYADTLEHDIINSLQTTGDEVNGRN